MSPVIRLPESTFDRLKRIAEPFVDTPADVISKLLDEYEERRDTETSVHEPSRTDIMAVDPENPPDLRHTSVLDARVDGKTVRPNWSHLVRALHGVALKQLGSFEKVQRVTRSNISQDETERGYQFAEELCFSIQSVEAKRAWANALHLAKELGVDIEVSFRWQNKDAALHPGKRARLTWPRA